MAYTPGSFSKNFGWHGTGLRKLHTAIRSAFHGTLAPIDRQSFRADSGVEDSIVLIPINFLLHNHSGYLSVDELVYQAIEHEHSLKFDRLALFALNHSRIGSGRNTHTGQPIVSRPAMWANEFVRDLLWDGGTWRADALQDDVIDLFLTQRLNATTQVRIKCRSNYRHLFVLCKYRTDTLPVINSGCDQWISSALFLAWDRHILDGGLDDPESLLGLIDADELYKLLGTTRGMALAQGKLALDSYYAVGRLDRFEHAEPVGTAPLTDLHQSAEVPEETGLIWLEQGELDGAVERRLVERSEQKRDRRKAAALKRHYENRCQFCGVRLEVADKRHYSEAAHIKALGEPHGGPDKVSNMLVLCPNHHLQFDRGVLRLRRARKSYQIRSKTTDHPLNGTTIKLDHVLDDDCVRHHYHWFES